MTNSMHSSLSYQDAGVSIDSGNSLVEKIKPFAKRTHRAGVLGGIGGFGALFELPLDRYQQPILVSSTDGVGTKLKLAQQYQKHDTIGIDLVAMCVNDIIVSGAEPLFFLDYYATGQLDVDVAAQVIEGISLGCEMAGAALVGGETAEMPGMYEIGDYDLAGFCVGIVEKKAIIDGSKVQAGDALIGIASSGIHSNGYSLVRKILSVSHTALDSDFHGQPLADVLLAPTKIYVKSLLKLIKTVSVHAISHITGGGLLENIPRVLPADLCAEIHTNTWKIPLIFNWLQQQGRVADQEMYRTFNCGVGMVVCVAPQELEQALGILTAMGETAWHLGNITANTAEQVKIIS